MTPAFLPLTAFFDLQRVTLNQSDDTTSSTSESTSESSHRADEASIVSSSRASFEQLAATTKAAFHVAARRRGDRWVTTFCDGADSRTLEWPRNGWRALPRESVGDAPDKIHPCYAMAILSARSPVSTLHHSLEDEPKFDLRDHVQAEVQAPSSTARSRADLSVVPTVDAASGTVPAHEYSWNTKTRSLGQSLLPVIDFSTAPEVRRSMTLNGMRMTIEWMQTGSRRVVQLIEQRLEAGQRDIVHDVLVYLMRQIIDARRRQSEARDLRAESVAAYLGLDQARVQRLFAAPRLSASAIAKRIEEGVAGPKRRDLDVEQLLRGQLAHLRPDLRLLEREEESLLWLLDEIVARLFADGEFVHGERL